MSDPRQCAIAALNDCCRHAMGLACIAVQTPGINALPDPVQSAIRERVETFNDWTAANDPFGEHDFGAFDVEDVRVFWKIDYYNADYTGGSDDPADATQTRRVLTIMLASEY